MSAVHTPQQMGGDSPGNRTRIRWIIGGFVFLALLIAGYCIAQSSATDEELKKDAKIALTLIDKNSEAFAYHDELTQNSEQQSVEAALKDLNRQVSQTSFVFGDDVKLRDALLRLTESLVEMNDASIDLKTKLADVRDRVTRADMRNRASDYTQSGHGTVQDLMDSVKNGQLDPKTIEQFQDDPEFKLLQDRQKTIETAGSTMKSEVEVVRGFIGR